MVLETEIILASKDHRSIEALRSITEKKESLSAGLVLSNVYKDIAGLIAHLERNPVPIVIVDIEDDPINDLNAIEPVINQYPRSRFVVLTQKLTSEVVLHAMQIGARHVQAKTDMAEKLPEALSRLAHSIVQPQRHLGHLITVLSSGGGCGSTTLAVNLSHELGLINKNPVLLVDMDYAYGAVATYLELQGQFGIADILRHPKGIDTHLVSTTAIRYSDNLHALLSPASINISSVTPVPVEPLESAMRVFKQAYQFTVIDAPRLRMEVAQTLAEASDMTLIVMQPSVKDVRYTKSLLKGLTDQGLSPDRFRPILNRYRKRYHAVTFEDAQRVLGNQYALTRLSNDYQNTLQGIDYGKTLADTAPRSTLRREFIALAEEMAGSTNGKYTLS